MKRLKLFFACLLMAVLSIGQVWAETVTYTVSTVSTVTTTGTAPDGSSASLSGTGSLNGGFIQCTSGNNSVLTLSGYEGYKITGITIHVRSNASKGKGSFSVMAGSTTIASIADAAFNTASWNGSWNSTGVDKVLTMTDDDYEIQDEDVVFTLAASANSMYIKNWVITYEEAGSTCETLAAPTNPSSTPAQTSVVLNWDAVEHASGYKVVFNGTEYNLASGTTSKTIEDLAMETEYHWTVAAKGDGTTYCAAGTATAQQSVTTLDACTANKAKYTVASTSSVTPSGALANTSATFANTYSTKDQMTNGNSQTLTLSGYDGATIKGLTLSMHANANQGAGTFSLMIGSTEVATISTATTFNKWFDNDSYGTTYRNVHIPFENDVVVGANENIVVTIAATTNSLYCQSFTFCYEDPAPVAVEKPAFTLATGTYLGTQSVEISCTTAGADIYYTLNGDDPSSGSTPYTSAISITETKTLKAIAIKDEVSSQIASATYTIINTEHAGTVADPYSVADAITVIDGIGTKEDAHVSGKISQVDSYDSNHKSITYWISADGTTSGQQLQVYSGKGLSGADFSSVDDVVAKATVVVKGKLKKYNDTYEFDYNNQLVSYEAPAEPIVTLSPSSLNLEAEGNGTQEITLTATNFENEVNEITCAFYNTAACDGEAISQPAWITNLTDNNSNQVSFDVADNDGDARQVWLKVTASDGTNSAFAVLAISQAKYTVDYAELPFAYDGNGSGELPNGFTNSGVGTYSSSPAMKFDGTGDYIIIKINAAPGTLTYDIKGNSFSGGTFKVQQSEDGTSYTDVETYTTLGDKQSESKTLEQDTRYIKFIYTEKVNGNVALGNIGITAYVAPVVTPTVAADPEEVEVDAEAHASQSLALTYENWGTVTVDEVEATLWNDAACTETFDGGWIINVAVAAGNVSVSFDIAANTGDARAAYMKIYALGDDGDTDAQTIVSISQAKYSAPSGTFELFSGDLAEGEYVICSGTNAMKNVVTSSPRIDVETVIVSENKIQNPDEGLIWKIEALTGDDAGKWTIYNESAGVYAAFNTTDGRGVLLDAVTDYAKWTTSGTYDFINVGKTSKNYLRYNDTYGFASYANTTGEELTLYKKSDGKPAAPTFTPAAGPYLGTQNVTINAVDGASIYYTTDGSTTPTTSSTLYTGAIEVSTTTTIKAIAVKDAVSSNVATATYTIINTAHAGTAEDPYSVADAKIVIDGIGTKEDAYVSGKISQVDEYLSSYKSITYWISADGTTSGQQLKVYSGKDIDGADFSSVDDVVAKATVVVKGTLKKYNDVYEFDYNNQLVSYSAPVEPVVTLSPSSLNLEAEGNGTQEITLTATNFENEVNEITCAFYNTAACDGEAISQPAWITNLTDNNSNQVSFDVADNDGDARQVWLKVTASDGTNSAFAVLAISQAKYTVDYAELPFAFDGGRADIENTNGMTQSGLDSDYGSSPKLKFNSANDVVIIKINAAPGALTYDIKGNSFSDGTFDVLQSANGVDYTAVATYTELAAVQSESKTLAQETRYVKFIYTAKSSGNVALGNIAISEYVEPEPPTPKVAKINDTEYETLPAAVAAAQDGDVVELLMDVAAGPGVMITTAEHKQIIIDFGNHTYCANSPAVGSAGTQNQAFHFEKGCNITLRNGTITSSGDEIKMLIQNYGDLTLLNITLIGNNLPGTHRYVLSNNCGNVVIGDGTTITAKEGDVAFDVCVTNYYPEGTQVTVENGATITGIVEYDVWGTIPADNKATLTIEGGNFDITWNVETALAEDAKDNINVEGGTFSAEVPADYCAPGYIPEDNGSGQYGVHYVGYYERGSLTPGNYATICLPNGGKISGASLFDIEYCENSTLYLLEVEGNTMVAGRPYIFLPSVEKIKVIYTDAENATAGTYNGLVGSLSLVAEVIMPDDGNYILYNNQYWYVNGEAYVGANRAYIHMAGVPTEPSTPQVGQAPRRRVAMAVNGEQVATGIDALNAGDAPVKMIIDGQLFILRGEKMFNANGQLVK